MNRPLFPTFRLRRSSRRRGMPCRPFGLLDGMILVAGVAVWIVAGRGVGLARDLEPGYWKDWLHPFFGVVLIHASCLMLVFRLRKPRPPIRRVVDQPGFVACFAMVMFAVVKLAIRCTQLAPGWTDRVTYAHLWGDFAVAFAGNFVVPLSVAVGWGLLILGRRWRPEPGWIDGVGRTLGYAWLAWGVLGWAVEMIDLFFPANDVFPANDGAFF